MVQMRWFVFSVGIMGPFAVFPKANQYCRQVMAGFLSFCFHVEDHEFLAFHVNVLQFHTGYFPRTDTAEGAKNQPGNVVRMAGIGMREKVFQFV